MSKQGNANSDSPHANIAEGENVLVNMPKVFEHYSKTGRNKCVKLKKTLYGLRQIPLSYWKYLTKKLKAWDFNQSQFDPCLFVGEKVLCIVYVDYLIF